MTCHSGGGGGMAEAQKSVLIELILPNTKEKMGAGITLYPKKLLYNPFLDWVFYRTIPSPLEKTSTTPKYISITGYLVFSTSPHANINHSSNLSIASPLLHPPTESPVDGMYTGE